MPNDPARELLPGSGGLVAAHGEITRANAGGMFRILWFESMPGSQISILELLAISLISWRESARELMTFAGFGRSLPRPHNVDLNFVLAAHFEVLVLALCGLGTTFTGRRPLCTDCQMAQSIRNRARTARSGVANKGRFWDGFPATHPCFKDGCDEIAEVGDPARIKA